MQGNKNKLKLPKYDFIISFGESCFTAILLRKLGLRIMSGPFDWCVGATFEERVNIFLNDFRDYFNKEDFEFKNIDASGKAAYLNKRTKITYNHDFPKDVDFDVSYPQIYEKYQRRIVRSLDKIKKSKNTLIVYIELPISNGGVLSNEELITISEKLDKNIDILYVKHNPTLEKGEVLLQRISEKVIFIECYNKSYDINAPLFANNFDNSKLCFKGINVKNRFFNVLFYKFSKNLKKIKEYR